MGTAAVIVARRRFVSCIIHSTMISITFLCLLGLLAPSFSWPSGAPKGACPDRIPHGHVPSVEGGSHTYVISAPASASQGQVIDVTISGGAFKGFMLQGVETSSSTSPPVGNFLGGNTLSCESLKDTATQNNPSKQDYTSQTVRYKVPAGTSQVVFRATIVKDYGNYYTDVFSAPVTIS